MIIAIVAADDKYGIAKNGKIPWHSKEDFAFFKKTTIGKGNNVIVMGRKTKESLPNFPLPDRKNIILTSKPRYDYEISSLDQIHLFRDYDDIFIIGGESVYNESLKLKLPQKILISRISGDFKCDKFIDINLIKKNYIIENYRMFDKFCLETWILC